MTIILEISPPLWEAVDKRNIKARLVEFLKGELPKPVRRAVEEAEPKKKTYVKRDMGKQLRELLKHGNKTAPMLSDVTGIDTSTIQSMLYHMIKRGEVEKVGGVMADDSNRYLLVYGLTSKVQI